MNLFECPIFSLVLSTRKKELFHMSQKEIGEQLGNEQQEKNLSGVTSDNNPLR